MRACTVAQRERTSRRRTRVRDVPPSTRPFGFGAVGPWNGSTSTGNVVGVVVLAVAPMRASSVVFGRVRARHADRDRCQPQLGVRLEEWRELEWGFVVVRAIGCVRSQRRMVVRDISVGRQGVEQLTCHQVLVALDALPAPQGRAIVAVSAGHRAYRDAAELLGDSEENTSSQIRSGLSRLATIFGHATNVGPS